MGLWRSIGLSKLPDLSFYVIDEMLTSWSKRNGFWFHFVPADVRLQIMTQLHIMKLITLQPLIIREEGLIIREAVDKVTIKERTFGRDELATITRWVRRQASDTGEGGQLQDGSGEHDAVDTSTEEVIADIAGRKQWQKRKQGDVVEDEPDMDSEEASKPTEREKARRKPWGGGKIEDGEFISNAIRRSIASAARFFRMNIRFKEDAESVAQLACKELDMVGWVHGTVPICSPMRTYNPTPMTFITHFHRDSDGYTRVPSTERDRFKQALFNVVNNRTSGRPAVAIRFARYCGKRYSYFPDPTENGIEQYSRFLTEGGYKYSDIKSSQFDLSGFPPSVDSDDINQYVEFLRIFAEEHLDRLVDMYYRFGGDGKHMVSAKEFSDELSNSISVAAAHSRRTRKGWAKRKFAVSQMMLDLVEVFSDFYAPEEFVNFAKGAEDGLKMFRYNQGERTDNKNRDADHTRGMIIYKRLLQYLKDRPKLCGFFGCEVRGDKVVIILSERPLHYGDLADHFPCKCYLDYQNTSSARLHNYPRLSVAHEYPVRDDDGDDPRKMWPQPVNDIMAYILDYSTKHKDLVPSMSKNFSVDNEESWRDYILEHGSDAREGWWVIHGRKDSCKSRAGGKRKATKQQQNKQNNRTKRGAADDVEEILEEEMEGESDGYTVHESADEGK